MLDIAGLKGESNLDRHSEVSHIIIDEVPTPIVDNHMILSYTNNGKTYFLDATGRYVPIDFPTSFIQGKEALIADGASNYIIKKVPIIPAEKNAVIDSTTIHLTVMKT